MTETKTLTGSDLPSKFIPYSFNSLEMQPFLVPQLMLLSKAASLDSLLPAIEALDAVLSVDANLLTDGDFYSLLAIQRLDNFKTPLVARWTCEDILFQENGGLNRRFTKTEIESIVEDWETASEEQRKNMTDPDTMQVVSVACGTDNVIKVSTEDLTVISLEKLELPEILDYPRINTLSDSMLMRQDPELTYMIDAARYIVEGETLADKIEVLRNQKNIALFEEAMKANLQNKHGISRAISKACTLCGSETTLTMDIGPKTFFDL